MKANTRQRLGIFVGEAESLDFIRQTGCPDCLNPFHQRLTDIDFAIQKGMTVGIIATDAAGITNSGNSEAVGAQTDSESVGAFGSGSTLIVKTGQLGTDSSKKYYAYFFIFRYN